MGRRSGRAVFDSCENCSITGLNPRNRHWLGFPSVEEEIGLLEELGLSRESNKRVITTVQEELFE